MGDLCVTCIMLALDEHRRLIRNVDRPARIPAASKHRPNCTEPVQYRRRLLCLTLARVKDHRGRPPRDRSTCKLNSSPTVDPAGGARAEFALSPSLRNEESEKEQMRLSLVVT